MDIIDILMARALHPDTKAEVSAREAKASADEAAAVADELQEALSIVEEIPTVNVTNENNSTAVSSTISVTTQSGGTQIAKYKNYKSYGDNEDGSMTQKAIKNYVNQRIAESGGGGGGGGGTTDFGEENADKIIIVGDDGHATVGSITEKSLIQTQIIAGVYTVADSYGLKIDYVNQTFTRDQNAIGVVDFSTQPIFKDIKRCLVDDNGEIVAFEGDELYEDDITSGYQTMVYIPKFYYLRVPLQYEGSLIKQEEIFIAPELRTGFKLHPAFINESGLEVDYFLFSAYEGCAYSTANHAYNIDDSAINFNTDKLSSVAGAKPASGVACDLTIANAEKIAQNRGEGWHINSMKAISAIQMLALIEFGSLNMQESIEKGISELTPPSFITNSSCLTGSTSSLGSVTGHAESSTDGTNTYYVNGKRAISYRGIENIWGNMWSMVGGIKIKKTNNNTFIPYIGNTLDYSGDYTAINMILPSTSGWINRFGYDEEFDWLLLPSDTNNGTSMLPVGDYYWTPSINDNETMVIVGGHWGLKESDGLFACALENAPTLAARSLNGRLIFVPVKNQIYYSNLDRLGE